MLTTNNFIARPANSLHQWAEDYFRPCSENRAWWESALIIASYITIILPLIAAFIIIVSNCVDPPVLPRLNLEARNTHNPTSLHQAVFMGNTALASSLIQQGADLNVRDNHGNTPLHLAIVRGSRDLARILLELETEANLNVRHNRVYAPPHFAILHENIIRILVEAGANLNVRNNLGYAPLHFAILHENIVRILVEAGANLNVRNNHGNTPLHLAVIQGNGVMQANIDTVRILVEAGANLEIRNHNNITPLNYAISTRSPEAVRVLAQSGANLEALYHEIFTPLYYAVLQRVGTIGNAQQIAADIEIIRILLRAGANAAFLDPLGQTIVHRLLDRRHTTRAACDLILPVFLEVLGPNLNIRDSNGRTPLEFAYQNQDWASVQHFINAGVDPFTLIDLMPQATMRAPRLDIPD